MEKERDVKDGEDRKDAPEPAGPSGYHPPGVEELLDAQELAREIHYAGVPISGGGGGG
jgi:hypothetical protein